MKKDNGFRIYINNNAGTVQSLGESALEAVIIESGINIDALYILPAKDLFDKLKDEEKTSKILIGGGDGTITGAAAILSNKDIPFGIIPLGTMNLLAKDLEIPETIHKALKAYAGGDNITHIDQTFANDNLFLCSAGIGAIPDSSNFREKNRTQSNALLLPRLTLFVFDRIDPSRRKTYEIALDQKSVKLKSASLVISNNEYTQSQNWQTQSLKRESLQEGTLALYTATPTNFWDKCRVLLKLVTGGWRKDPKISEWKSKKITIKCPQKTERVSLDGENIELTTPIHFTLKPKSLAVITPKEAQNGQ